MLTGPDHSRSSVGCYPSSPTSYTSDLAEKFTGQERDEIQLDFVQARYFSAAQGRFTSPDPLLNAGRPAKPQTWNKYPYVLNNPLRYTDPTGLYEVVCPAEDKECEDNRQLVRDALTGLRNIIGGMTDQLKQARARAALEGWGAEGDSKVQIYLVEGPTIELADGSQIVVDGVTEWNSAEQTANVLLDPNKLFGNDGLQLFAHEGTHLGDYQDANYGPDALSPFQGEYRAFQTQIFVREAMGINSLVINGFTVWNLEWGSTDLMNQTLKEFLHNERPTAGADEPPDPWGENPWLR